MYAVHGESETPRFGGMIIMVAEDEFYIAGSGVVITFQSSSDDGMIAGVASIDEGTFVKGNWVAGRRLNGAFGASRRLCDRRKRNPSPCQALPVRPRPGRTSKLPRHSPPDRPRDFSSWPASGSIRRRRPRRSTVEVLPPPAT